jgi:SAM-dependent methyltransferase
VTEGDEQRLQREREYHDDRFAHDTRARAAKYYTDSSASRRAYQYLLDEIPSGAMVLEYGCGTGSAAFDLARRGVDVVGVDLSSVAITEAARAAASAGLHRARFEQMNAEALAFREESFDTVCGSGVLHHLELRSAFAELARVLKPSGGACFFEPMGHNPLINLYRRLTPSMRTVDEHPLRMSDFDVARRWFGDVRTSFFELSSIAAGPLVRYRAGSRARATLERADAWLIERVSLARKWSWIVVVELRSPRR